MASSYETKHSISNVVDAFVGENATDAVLRSPASRFALLGGYDDPATVIMPTQDSAIR